MTDSQTAIQRQFDRSAAGAYDAHAHVQRSMANALLQSLKGRLPASGVRTSDILEIGCGTGYVTEKLLTELTEPPPASITAVDLAPAMLAAAQQRIQRVSAQRGDLAEQSKTQVQFLLEDVELWAANAAPASFDIIISNACFQWLRDPQRTLVSLRRLLRPGGVIAFSTFGPETFHELHQAFAKAYCANGLTPQRHGKSFPSGDAWDRLLQAAGFSDRAFEQWLHVEEHASVSDFLHAVKAVGASTSEASPSRGLGSRRLFTQMYGHYEQAFSSPKGIRATYEVYLFLAQE
ncbi:malonyl-ACP O-methyltransferase BioC [Paenibacillus roseipurpureus]|uniref:Malonyl-[acyl-carrier protein] O-methyltransferase n=1 Tax=Paenibacillus roseopurpureus TaxID=2918901 RepID=A0AA96LQX9_9BACL|nr:malonyl-ACP O-methyltransferase BioC [Paenibacillus sp. MBLB1832]WNR44936.1 malonyl-ACP O-methyltransferase BioC [Paenibacillus sp. MBLB1832]